MYFKQVCTFFVDQTSDIKCANEGGFLKADLSSVLVASVSPLWCAREKQYFDLMRRSQMAECGSLDRSIAEFSFVRLSLAVPTGDTFGYPLANTWGRFSFEVVDWFELA